MDTHTLTLLTYPSSVAIDQIRIPDSTQHHLTREPSHTVEAHAYTVFTVDGHEDGRSGDGLKKIDQGGLLHRCALEKTDGSDIVLPYSGFDRGIEEYDLTGGIDRREPDDHQLAYLLIRREGSKNTVHPLILRKAAAELRTDGGTHTEQKEKAEAITHHGGFQLNRCKFAGCAKNKKN
jgi:hypothetical protein